MRMNAQTLTDVANAFRRRGLRATPQRLAIAAVVLGTDRHPSVQEVYEEVRKAFPTTGLATVYNTLHALAELGFVQELPYPGGLRFDADPAPHINLVCDGCGAIIDAHEWDATVEMLRRHIAEARGFDVRTQRLDFYGRCSQCRTTDSGAPAPA